MKLYLKRNESEAILQHSIRIGEPVMTVWAALLVNNSALFSSHKATISLAQKKRKAPTNMDRQQQQQHNQIKVKILLTKLKFKWCKFVLATIDSDDVIIT